MRNLLKWLHVSKWKVLSILLVMLAIASGYFFLHDTETTYEFDSNLDFDGEMICCTSPIELPWYLQNEGIYEYINNTGCTIYVHERKDGLIKLLPGECHISGEPVVFFVATPENSYLSEEMSGELLIKRENIAFSGSYIFKVWDTNSLDCTYHTKFIT